MNWFKKLKTDNDFKCVFFVFLTTRVALLLLALFCLGFVEVGRNINLVDALSQWDGQWYLRIAREGYHWQGPDIQANVAFFPLYPIFAKILSLILRDVNLSFFLVSNVSFFFFLLFLYKIAKKHWDKDLAIRAVWYLSIFPLSFVFLVFYSESLFLMLAAGSIYFAYLKNWKVAGLFALLSGATRLSGVILLPVLLYCYFTSVKKRKVLDLLSILAIPLGAIIFSLYLWFKAGDPLAYLSVLASWHIVWQNPLYTVISTFSLLSKIPRYNYFAALGVFDLGMLALFLMLLILSYKRLPRELFLLSFLIFLVNLPKSWDPSFFYPLGSTNRYLLEAFPLFFVLAKLGKNKIFDLSYTIWALFFLGILSLSFFAGKWVL